MSVGSPNVWTVYTLRVRRTAQLVRVLTPRDLKARYRRSSLDLVWALITPAALAATYGIILTQSFGVEGTCAPYLSTAWVGLVIWTFFATALGSGVNSLTSSTDLVTKVYFPREALPLSTVAATLADLGVGLVMAFVILVLQGVSVTPVAVLFVLPVMLAVIWTAAVTIMASVMTVFVRDIAHGVQLLLRVGFFGTPVMYDASFLPPPLEWTASVNPIGVAITSLRDVLLCGQIMHLQLLVTHLAVAFGALVFAVVYTSSVESRIADQI